MIKDPAKVEMLLEEQQKLVNLFTNSKTIPEVIPFVPVSNFAPSIDDIINSMTEFIYDQKASITFDIDFGSMKICLYMI